MMILRIYERTAPPLPNGRGVRRLGRMALLAAAMAAGFLAAPAHSQSMEERLRAELRRTTQSLQQLQSRQAQLDAARTAAESQRDAAQKEVEQLRAQLAKAEGAAAQLAGQQDAMREAAQAQVAASHEQVGKFKDAYDELLGLARATEARRSSLDASLKTSEAQLTVCKQKNDQLYAAGKELLTAYESFSTGDLLRIRQPFAGQARVLFDEQAQQYGDKLYEGKFDARAVAQPQAAQPPDGMPAQ
ncbi:MAG TPA: DNA repair protein [Bordetella sp.]|nr:DNA repair protein [Bordetella sp.]